MINSRCKPNHGLPRDGKLKRQDAYRTFPACGRNFFGILSKLKLPLARTCNAHFRLPIVAEREGGTQQPASVCDVEYYGLTSPVEGSVVHPEPHRLFAMEGPVKCRQHFIPAPNQSVIITVSYSTRCFISTVQSDRPAEKPSPFGWLTNGGFEFGGFDVSCQYYKAG